MMKCNIAGDTNHLHQGLELGLTEDREKNSEALGRLALFKGKGGCAHWCSGFEAGCQAAGVLAGAALVNQWGEL